MYTRILMMLSLSLMLVACAAQLAPAGGPGSSAVCSTQRMRPCKGNPQAPTININTRSGRLKATPECVKAAERTLLIFRLTPAAHNATNTVKILPKDPDDPKDDWLDGTNDKYADLIMIDVPENLADGDYEYRIETGTDCLDPRVHVE